MTKHAQAQIHALDRVMYLLEENSIQSLTTDNQEFADFIEELYASVDNRIARISISQR
jgi:signal-transduction protein with cAMP-binding, CBS, and nucleotidyltransferase domain